MEVEAWVQVDSIVHSPLPLRPVRCLRRSPLPSSPLPAPVWDAGTGQRCPPSSCRCGRSLPASCARCAPTGGCPWRTLESWQQQLLLGRGRVRLWTRRTSTPWQPPSLQAWRPTIQVGNPGLLQRGSKSMQKHGSPQRRVLPERAAGHRGRNIGAGHAASRAPHCPGAPATWQPSLRALPHLAGSVPNIFNTISKLHAFPWNELPLVPGQQQRRQQQGGAQPLAQQQQEAAAPASAASARDWAADSTRQQLLTTVLCPICLAPLADDELPGSAAMRSSGSSSEHTSGGQGAAARAAAAGCCLSCYSQILAGCSAPGSGSGQGAAAKSSEPGGSSPVVTALPAAMTQQMAALAAAGQSAADAEAAATAGGGPADGSCRLERLRTQIAAFLLD